MITQNVIDIVKKKKNQSPLRLLVDEASDLALHGVLDIA